MEKLPDIDLNSFMDMTKKIINRVKRQHMRLEKIFANHTFEMRVIFKVYKELQQLKSKKKKKKSYNLILKCTKNLNKHYSIGDIQMANSYMKKMLSVTSHQRNASQDHNEILLHISIECYYQKSKRQQALKRIWRKWTLAYSWWECKVVQLLWKTV